MLTQRPLIILEASCDSTFRAHKRLPILLTDLIRIECDGPAIQWLKLGESDCWVVIVFMGDGGEPPTSRQSLRNKALGLRRAGLQRCSAPAYRYELDTLSMHTVLVTGSEVYENAWEINGERLQIRKLADDHLSRGLRHQDVVTIGMGW